MYMPKANPTLAYPTRTTFHLLVLVFTLGGNTNFGVRVWSARLFGYQHVGLPNAKWGHTQCEFAKRVGSPSVRI